MTAEAGTPAPWHLQAQLQRQLLGLLTAMWLVGTAATTAGIWRETDEVLDSALTETAQRLVLLPAAAMVEPDTAEKLATLGPHTEHVVYQVFDAAGHLQLHSHDAPPQALDAGAPDGLRRSGDWRVLTLTSPDGQRRTQVAETLAHRHEVLWASLGWLLGTLLALLPLTALTLGWVLRRGFRALEPARRSLARRAPDDLRPLAIAHAPEELKPWLETVNLLLLRVDSLVASERAFAANTAHELRTPLAAARAQAQRLALSSTDPAVQAPAQALLRQLDRLTRLATRLLQLARVESGVALQHQPVDLVQLAMLVADDYADAVRHGRLSWQVHGQPTPVHGDIDALGIALRNLIDNALKHGGTDCQVVVHIDGHTLRVDDNGPGVPADRLPGLAQKFTRAHGAAAVEGSGLGLSLVRTIARQSGARLVLASPGADGPGFSASLCFGVAPAAASSPPTP